MHEAATLLEVHIHQAELVFLAKLGEKLSQFEHELTS